MILILSHKGKSFVAEWAAIARERHPLCLLSSKPTEAARDSLRTLAPRFERVLLTEDDHLTLAHVMNAIAQLRREGVQIRACVSVWEGHRELMSRVNEQLEAPDLPLATTRLLRDKLRCRETLRAHGLSQVDSFVVTENSFHRLETTDRSWFVKPRSGVASFGAFRWTASCDPSLVKSLRDQIQADPDYHTVINHGLDFIAEQCIEGREYSFEALVGAGSAAIFAIHEKVEMEWQGLTTLENACVSPPVSLSPTELSAGVQWVNAVLAALEIREGCFHIEARFDGVRWEVIEINPRIGGAYIYESAKQVTQGFSLLEGWISLLAEPSPEARRRLISQWSLTFSLPHQQRSSTFFRVFYAMPKSIIKSLEWTAANNWDGVQFCDSKTFLKAGIATADAQREVFAAQALWSFPTASVNVERLRRMSQSVFRIEYQEVSL